MSIYLSKQVFTLWPLVPFDKIKVAPSQKRLGTTALDKPYSLHFQWPKTEMITQLCCSKIQLLVESNMYPIVPHQQADCQTDFIAQYFFKEQMSSLLRSMQSPLKDAIFSYEINWSLNPEDLSNVLPFLSYKINVASLSINHNQYFILVSEF